MAPIIGTFHDAQTGETVVRELTTEEIAQLPEAPVEGEPIADDEPTEEPVDDLVESEQL